MPPMHPRRELLYVWRVYLALISVIPALLIALLFRAGLWAFLAAIWAILFVSLYAAYLPALYKRKAYSLEKDNIISHGGLIFRYTHSLPLRRIQYVCVVSSPLDRVFHVCALVIIAPGGRMVLPGLALSDGNDLARILTEMEAESHEE